MAGLIVCDKCHKGFSSLQTLKTHQLTIKCSKNINTANVCEHCEKKFSSKQMLTYHQNICVDKKLNDVKSELTNETCPLVINKEGRLFHSCVTSPSCNLFLNGTCTIEEGEKSVDVFLPAYVEKGYSNFTVSLTPKGVVTSYYYTDGVIDGKYFTVHCDRGSEFFWHVYGQMVPAKVQNPL
jgi:hypothetical protein